MTVYVDDMEADFGRMVMCHMLADTDEELLAMADRIGVARKWHQYPGTPRSHFDIAKTKRAAALAAGAMPIRWRDSGRICMHRRKVALGKAEPLTIAAILALPDGVSGLVDCGECRTQGCPVGRCRKAANSEQHSSSRPAEHDPFPLRRWGGHRA